jgi:hypothetical protein
MSDDGSPKGGYAQLGVYPHDATHPNPHHFTNVAPYTSYAQPAATSPTTPWNATGPNGYGLGFTAPQPSAGLMQPTQGVALGPDASAVDRARNAHGPHCTSIPQLRMSDYPDANGVRSLWSMCPDCGALERTS